LIVSNASQDKVLAALQLVAGIIERRHTLPILGDVLIGGTPVAGMQFAHHSAVRNSKGYDAQGIPARGALGWKPRGIAGFSALRRSICVTRLEL
jgi:hypothetical protein